MDVPAQAEANPPPVPPYPLLPPGLQDWVRPTARGRPSAYTLTDTPRNSLTCYLGVLWPSPLDTSN